MIVVRPTISTEMNCIEDGAEYIIGVDEVGAGCLAGPVLVCAVMFDADFFRNNKWQNFQPRDSKSLSELQRQKFVEQASQLPGGFKFAFAQSSPQLIDEINILNATHSAMAQAISSLQADQNKAHVLIDGNKTIKNIGYKQTAIIKGDINSYAIAFASIMAKVERDNLMKNYDAQYPRYGFAKHKGYGTKDHFAKIADNGISPIHRRSFLKKI